MSFEPKLSVLPAAQRRLWPELKQVPRNFVLYGGTGLALRFGHRKSEDFDFFADAPIAPQELLHSVRFLEQAVPRQMAPNTLTVEINRAGAVKLSFFGLKRRRIEDPEITSDGVLLVASLIDIAAFKMAVLPQRSESKDYLDAYALLENGVTLPEALGAAAAVYGGQFNPALTLKALNYFNDGDLAGLPARVKKRLQSAAAAVTDIATYEPMPGGLVPSA